MTQAQVQELASDSACALLCAPGEKSLLAMLVYLLWIEQNPGGDMNQAAVQALQDESGCLVQCMTPKQLLAAAVQLLSDGGGGGGGLAFSTGTGSPEGAVVGSPGDTYWDTDTDNYYIKVTGTGTNTGWAIH